MNNRKAFKIGLKKWRDKSQIDENLKALSDIKVIVDRFYEKGYTIEWELDEIIDRIEKTIENKKLKNQAIGNIRLMIKEHYEQKGRDKFTNLNEMIHSEEILFKKIRKLIKSVSIPENYSVISRLKIENENKDL